MAQSTSNFFSIFFLVVQFINLNVAVEETSADHDNRTDFTPQWNLDRWKRSPAETMPVRLRIRVKYTNGEEVELNWLRKPNYLANENLPVRSASGLLYRSVMTSLGDFLLYRDVEKCSSVVYFKNSNTFIGHIGISHIIDELPNQFDADGKYPGVVGAPYIIGRHEVLGSVQPTSTPPPITAHKIRGDFSHSSIRHMNENDKRRINSEPGPTSKYQKTEAGLSKRKSRIMTNPNVITDHKTRKRRGNAYLTKYYLEILVFITHDVAEMFESFYRRDSYKESMTRYLLRKFNAVQTIFDNAKPIDVEMNINIAKIIILDNADLHDSVESGQIRFAGTVSKLRKHLRDRPSRFTPDSFDHVFMITSHQIIDKSVRVPAMTDYSPDLYQKRDEGQFYNAVPITITEFGSNYIYGVHEISRTLNIKIGPSFEEMEASGQCDSIMQEGSAMCNRCLKWSENSKQQLGEYFRDNTNRCFLLNEPRSLRPPGPSIFVTANRQCQCFGSQSFAFNVPGHLAGTVKANECSVALQCESEVDGRSIISYFLPPFDGTRCGSSKVCWMGECVPVKRKSVTSNEE